MLTTPDRAGPDGGVNVDDVDVEEELLLVAVHFEGIAAPPVPVTVVVTVDPLTVWVTPPAVWVTVAPPSVCVTVDVEVVDTA